MGGVLSATAHDFSEGNPGCTVRAVRRALVFLAILAVALGACTTVEAPPGPTPGPDRVVGIELKCDIGERTFTGWDTCPRLDSIGSDQFVNYRKEVTVRTFAGQTYRVSYGAEHDVWLGMEWPPK